MSAQIVVVDEANFEAEVAQSDRPVLMDFWAPWCGPCMALMPTLQALAPLYADSLKVVKINIDEAAALAERFDVRGIPLLMLARQGKVVAVLNERSRTRLANELDGLLD